MMTIEWWDIPGYQGRYQVSNDGRVMSFVRRVPKQRKTGPDRFGYQRVMLSIGGRQKLYLVHRLMALTFLADSWFEGAVVCHNDGNKDNNTIENLRWDTVRENNLDQIRHGTHNWYQGDSRPRHRPPATPYKTHCLRGHEFSGRNLSISISGRRNCRACEVIRDRNIRNRKKAEAQKLSK